MRGPGGVERHLDGLDFRFLSNRSKLNEGREAFSTSRMYQKLSRFQEAGFCHLY